MRLGDDPGMDVAGLEQRLRSRYDWDADVVRSIVDSIAQAAASGDGAALEELVQARARGRSWTRASGRPGGRLPARRKRASRATKRVEPRSARALGSALLS